MQDTLKDRKMMSDDEKLRCGDCQYYRSEDSECMFGGGWFHYPSPDDYCERMNYDDIEDEVQQVRIPEL